MSKLYVVGHLGTDRFWVNGTLISEFFGGSVMHFVNGLSFTSHKCEVISSCNRNHWAEILEVWSRLDHNIEQINHTELDAVFNCHYNYSLQFDKSLFSSANVRDAWSNESHFIIKDHSHVHLGPLPIDDLDQIFSHIKRISRVVFSAQTHMSLIEDSRDSKKFSDIANQMKVLFLNLEEAAILSRSNKKNIRGIVDYYSKLGPIVFITDSHRALVVSSQYFSDWVEAPHIEVVDPTGAGDTFAGVALGMLLGGSHAATALCTAIAIASLSTTGVLANSLFSIHRDAHKNRFRL